MCIVVVRSVHLPWRVDAQWDAIYCGQACGQPARGVHELPDAGCGQCAADNWRRLSAEPADANGAPFGGQLDGLW